MHWQEKCGIVNKKKPLDERRTVMKKLGKPILLIALVLVVGLGALFGYSGLLQPCRSR